MARQPVRSALEEGPLITLYLRNVSDGTLREYKAQAVRAGVRMGPYLTRVTALLLLVQAQARTRGAIGAAAREALVAAGLLAPP